MKMTIEMPKVMECEAEECVYNREGDCHARAITVGDGDTPACDTYMGADRHANRREEAGVGACKVTGCRHNSDFECIADSILVGRMSNQAQCQTFTMV